MGIAAAVPALVVAQGDLAGHGVGVGAEDVGAVLRVLLHDVPLPRLEGAALFRMSSGVPIFPTSCSAATRPMLSMNCLSTSGQSAGRGGPREDPGVAVDPLDVVAGVVVLQPGGLEQAREGVLQQVAVLGGHVEADRLEGARRRAAGMRASGRIQTL